MAEVYAVVKGGQVGLFLRSIYRDLGIPMKVEIQSDSSTANSLTDRWEQDSERNTLTRGTFGHKNEFKTEISVSKRCFQRRTAHMLERRQSLLQYYNNIASLQDWYSTDHGSHTRLQDDDDEPMTELVTRLQSRHEHRPKEDLQRNLQHRTDEMSTLVVNIETDVQAE